MTLELNLVDAIKARVGERVFPDVAPLNTARPYITFQQVGGTAWNYLESAPVDRRNARIQVNCWAATRKEAAALARLVEADLVSNTATRAFVLGAFVSTYVDDLELFGTNQDFSINY